MKTKKTLKDTVVEGLYREIEEGIYKPNDIIHEGEIMEKYAMSKSPVREALIELCKDNVLKSIANCETDDNTPRMEIDWIRIYTNKNYVQTDAEKVWANQLFY